MIETIIFAMLAAFLGLRLYSVLGKRTGHEHTIAKPAEEAIAPAGGLVSGDDAREKAPARITQFDSFEAEAATGLRAIAGADSAFNAANFVEGSKGAYGLILDAFWRGDAQTLDDHCSDDVRDAFNEAIKTRTDAGEVLDNRLVSIETAVISHAQLDGKLARITVRFDADIAAVTRGADGKVVAGSLTDAVSTHDEWTFERQIRTADPNWTLVDTDEAS